MNNIVDLYMHKLISVAACFLVTWATNSAFAVAPGTEVAESERQLDAVCVILTRNCGGPSQAEIANLCNFTPTSSSTGANCNCVCDCPFGGFISGTGVLVAPDLVVTARHVVAGPRNTNPLPNATPNDPSTWRHKVRFRRSKSGEVENTLGATGCLGDFQEAWITQFYEINGINSKIDIVICRIACAPAGISPMPIDLNIDSINVGSVVCIAGWGDGGNVDCPEVSANFEEACNPMPNRLRISPMGPIILQEVESNGARRFSQRTCEEQTDCRCAKSSRTIICDEGEFAGWVHDSGAPFLRYGPCEPGSETYEYRVVGFDTLHTSNWNMFRESGSPEILHMAYGCTHCPADHNRDGERDVVDLFAYINDYLNKKWIADFNTDGSVNVTDLFAYINAWIAKC